jgi:hypothetical protein
MEMQLAKLVLIDQGFESLFKAGKSLVCEQMLKQNDLQVVDFNIDNLCLRVVFGFLIVL